MPKFNRIASWPINPIKISSENFGLPSVVNDSARRKSHMSSPVASANPPGRRMNLLADGLGLP
jgi:hypothetical protein